LEAGSYRQKGGVLHHIIIIIPQPTRGDSQFLAAIRTPDPGPGAPPPPAGAPAPGPLAPHPRALPPDPWPPTVSGLKSRQKHAVICC
jgi:hypothetical protein